MPNACHLRVGGGQAALAGASSAAGLSPFQHRPDTARRSRTSYRLRSSPSSACRSRSRCRSCTRRVPRRRRRVLPAAGARWDRSAVAGCSSLAPVPRCPGNTGTGRGSSPSSTSRCRSQAPRRERRRPAPSPGTCRSACRSRPASSIRCSPGRARWSRHKGPGNSSSFPTTLQNTNRSWSGTRSRAPVGLAGRGWTEDLHRTHRLRECCRSRPSPRLRCHRRAHRRSPRRLPCLNRHSSIRRRLRRQPRGLRSRRTGHGDAGASGP